MTEHLEADPAMLTTPDKITKPGSMAERLSKLLAQAQRPVLVSVDCGPRYDPLARASRAAGVPVFRSADDAVRSLGRYRGSVALGSRELIFTVQRSGDLDGCSSANGTLLGTLHGPMNDYVKLFMVETPLQTDMVALVYEGSPPGLEGAGAGTVSTGDPPVEVGAWQVQREEREPVGSGRFWLRVFSRRPFSTVSRFW